MEDHLTIKLPRTKPTALVQIRNSDKNSYKPPPKRNCRRSAMGYKVLNVGQKTTTRQQGQGGRQAQALQV